MSIIVSLVAVVALAGAAWFIDLMNGQFLLGVIVPYAALLLFVAGFVWRIVEWARVPVPFRIPTTCGQEKSFPWINHDKLDNPSNLREVLGRMFLEVFTFRSLFRNTKATPLENTRLVYGADLILWLMGLAFHYSFLVIIVRHFRLFVHEVPVLISIIESFDGFIQLTLPTFYITDAVIIGALGVLLLRRVVMPQVKYISLPADYFPLLLIGAIALTGIMMRYLMKVDIVSVKAAIVGLMTFNPVLLPRDQFYIFYIHLFLVSSLLAYFPFSKLMHMGGVFMSPTRNLANTSRVKRHINPWNDPNIKPHSYEEYEDDFRKAMKSVGLPLEKED